MKKVLVISYYFPPCGGVSVLRTLKFIKYLRDFGWEPIVYAPLNAEYESYDENNFKDLPENLTVIRRKIFEPFSLFKKISGRKKNETANPVFVRDRKLSLIDRFSIWVRGNFFIPDARMFWIRPSVRFLTKYIKENHIDAILSEGPPHTNTMIACKLAQKTGIPWLMQFQDPWTQVDYYKMFHIGKCADKKHHRLEKICFDTASKTTIVSSHWKHDLESIGAKNVEIVYWGYDEQDFPNQKYECDEKFSIIHAGLLGYDRRPDVFLKVLGDLKKENKDFAEDLQINFLGKVDYCVTEMIKDNNLIDNYYAPGDVIRPTVIEMTMKSHLLLLLLNIAENAKGRIPGKLFENLRAERPIICLGPTDGDVANILTETNCGKTFEYNDYDNIKNYIMEKYRLFKEGKNYIHSEGVEKFTSRNLTKQISEYLDIISR